MTPMDNMEYIENYFQNRFTEAQRQQFEKKILDDTVFAEDVAFYISANGAIKQQLYEDKKQGFREIYEQQTVVKMKPPVRNLWRYLAAASVIIAVVLVAWFVSASRTLPQQLAGKYVQQNWKTLSVTMGNSDSLQTAINLFNAGKLEESLNIFESLGKKDPANSAAKKYAGIVSFRLGNYEKALAYFSMLEADTALYSNPGKFYKAVTLMERNKEGDKETAKQLLQEVVDRNLEGKNEAIKWIKKF